jgi:dihydropteroate synthase
MDAASAAGMDLGAIVLDPGLGFAKVGQSNWRLLAGLDRIAALGRPLLVGASRKRFLAAPLDAKGDWPRLDAATAAVSFALAVQGVWCVRVHNVEASLDAVTIGACQRLAGTFGEP